MHALARCSVHGHSAQAATHMAVAISIPLNVNCSSTEHASHMTSNRISCLPNGADNVAPEADCPSCSVPSRPNRTANDPVVDQCTSTCETAVSAHHARYVEYGIALTEQAVDLHGKGRRSAAYRSAGILQPRAPYRSVPRRGVLEQRRFRSDPYQRIRGHLGAILKLPSGSS